MKTFSRRYILPSLAILFLMFVLAGCFFQKDKPDQQTDIKIENKEANNNKTRSKEIEVVGTVIWFDGTKAVDGTRFPSCYALVTCEEMVPSQPYNNLKKYLDLPPAPTFQRMYLLKDLDNIESYNLKQVRVTGYLSEVSSSNHPGKKLALIHAVSICIDSSGKQGIKPASKSNRK
ncbi:hypothetical protein ACFL54_03075 [Planctomycetota bacterium]